ncbi:hypothetical protein PsorP6_014635 [Peronosclerospora sorghi]|uniref:Uncharacterized protein n=1 Tax=Peronosclerospora sorghi TaxID=230839 RepID=A0ACC0VSR9_9STRA|nr:hypothetical protein PsorP6_014635 [Peronosclerospora sorghi]
MVLCNAILDVSTSDVAVIEFGSNKPISVQSPPADSIKSAMPPGWNFRYGVMLYTLPSKTLQQRPFRSISIFMLNSHGNSCRFQASGRVSSSLSPSSHSQKNFGLIT